MRDAECLPVMASSKGVIWKVAVRSDALFKYGADLFSGGSEKDFEGYLSCLAGAPSFSIDIEPWYLVVLVFQYGGWRLRYFDTALSSLARTIRKRK